ncbi:PTS lactose/cellobiose transporter subunit IIA [Lacticaseibacillus parahuelsenbergensis]|uniref:PTS lactose/cellobiose transporter subunit IIA n=1 Tax=Lacticaseibacillus parahuelsenbergensis TaxID=3068305 RepID=A0ABY9L406_9LACO|nr:MULTISPECIES: PTS lactose/cellobiose transporter subunit IIA [Lacticaseibacillus]MDE3281512.1 PTS lactose/cellobiose transporter subunit IIA [Lacticaseibacillus casei]WLV78428.1 PTS lactose/cellobiose transporter subunit IIA [Lacticaseibacillus sp. NCIMB 15471]
MEKEINTDEGSMQIILHAGNAKSSAFEALKEVKLGHIDSYRKYYQTAKSELVLAEKAHAVLLRDLANADRMKDVDLLLVHAEGHLSSTDIAVQLIGEIGEILEWKGALENA